MLKVEYEDREALGIEDREVGRIEGLIEALNRNLRTSIKKREQEIQDKITGYIQALKFAQPVLSCLYMSVL